MNKSNYKLDCPSSDDTTFVPTILPVAKRIIAIGDIHGDYNLAVRSFKLANLIDDNFEWIANPPETIVVQVGDQIDSCRPIPGLNDCKNNPTEGDINADLKVMKFFNYIDKKARERGGMVISLLGNHELMNAEGNFTYVSYKNLHHFHYFDENGKIYQGEEGRKDAFKRGGPIAKMMGCTRNSLVVIGSNLFVHAGIIPDLAAAIESIQYLNLTGVEQLEYINSTIRKWLIGKILDKRALNTKKLLINNIKLSPFWTRIYGSIPVKTNIDTAECDTYVKKILHMFKLGQIIVGHTPQLYAKGEGINGTCADNGANRLFRVDGGFANAFRIFDNNNVVQVLEILDDKIYNILTDDKVDLNIKIPDIDMHADPDLAKIFSQDAARTRIRARPSSNLNSNVVI